MNLENIKAQMRKGVLEYCILSIINNAGRCYASQILDQLKNADLLVVEGTIYPLLTRLKNDGYLSYEWEESRSGPPRKYYQLTDTGKAFLQQLARSWNELVHSVAMVTDTLHHKSTFSKSKS
ncbi:MAG: PadR family transcriptional regulator [Chitinophagales bacterium]|nr:PadR family transcriptional regulator [Chitinophagales bacterium]MDW8428877.1 PadR family transcriptional regulator [Chitinophagales bacterium]